jgi:ribosomal protein S12 methylthiotransferase
MKAYVVSLGCPKNLTDTEVLMGQLVSAGYQIVNDPSAADIIIVNTCAFLKSARREALAVIREMASWKKRGKCKKLYIAGCLPKLGNRDVQSQVSRLVDGVIDSLGLFDYCTPRIKATPPWTAYVKVAEGCNNCCSYCLIPTIRGRLKTRKLADIINEVKLLAKRGVKEIIYVAQDTTAYPGFAQLLKKTAGIKGIHWIRILYAHPAHLNAEIIKTIASEKKIVKYLDLPIQHINDAILKRMNRKYARLDLEHLISKLRKRIPGITLRTSVIVGFPGEGEKEFAELMDFIKDNRFDRLGVFKYEREKGAAAAGMKPQVSEKKKEMRFRKLMRLQARISKELNRKMVGKSIAVLVEGKKSGRSYRDAPDIDGKVMVKSRGKLEPGFFIKAKIIKSGIYDLIGTCG